MSVDLYSKFDAGAKIWVPHCNSVWIGGTILENHQTEKTLKVLKDDGEITEINVSPKTSDRDHEKYPFLRNPEILIGQNDLTSLSYLNEPEVLYNLQVRFCDRREIYTYCGIVLVAINPYQELPIYDQGIIGAYHSQQSSDLDPHIYAVAENAFRRLTNFGENQSVIVSGESGAGKTVSAKYTMRYFAVVAAATSKNRPRPGTNSAFEETQIEKKVLSSNPVMEALGNAKTNRNDNSSRFGKYVQIEFSATASRISGASMRTYLLEKSRVVFQNYGERNYHIFYQLVAAAAAATSSSSSATTGEDLLSDRMLHDLELEPDPEQYLYLNRGCTTEIDGVDDVAEFTTTKASFLQLGIKPQQLKTILEIIAAILHLGNVTFSPDKSNEGSFVEEASMSHLATACRLLGIPRQQLAIWLCFRPIATWQESLNKPLSVEEALHFKDSLAKFIYDHLFHWAVSKINESLSGSVSQGSSCSRTVATSAQPKFIGVLDIYGFETFEENSFEQFCINFANEKLQQQFTMHVFKLEQEEYMKEGLQWTFIEYYNNQPCIDLIESKLGLLDLLDEECKMLNSSDDNWCRKIFSQHLSRGRHFSRPRLSQGAFCIEHFAGTVRYECVGFIAKNRDSVLEQQLALLFDSQVDLVREMVREEDVESVSSPSGVYANHQQQQRRSSASGGSGRRALDDRQDKARKMKRTVGGQFQNSLKQLMEILDKTTPHYVRCIKPNDLKLPFTFCPQRAVQQLRACGVLETIRLSAAGFPSRWTYAEFYQRYCLLLPASSETSRGRNFNPSAMKPACQVIVQRVMQDTECYRFGHNKLFFRSGQVAYLEKLRGDKICWAVTLVQRRVRGAVARRCYLAVRRLAHGLQSAARGWLARQMILALRRSRAALRIQTFYRMRLERRRYLTLSKAVRVIQAWWHVSRSRQLAYRAQMTRRVVLCQAVARAFIYRLRYKKFVRAVTLLQNHWRRRNAKEQLRTLRIEARSISHVQNINKGLENKIIELSQRLDQKDRDARQLQITYSKEKKHECASQKLTQMDTEKRYSLQIEGMNFEICKLKRELNKEILDKNRLIAERESLDLVYKTEFEKYEKRQAELMEQIKEMQKLSEESTNAVCDEGSREAGESYQRLMQSFTELEARYRQSCEQLTACGHPPVAGDLREAGVKVSVGATTEPDHQGDSSQHKPGQLPTTGPEIGVIIELRMHVANIRRQNYQLRSQLQQLENQLLQFQDNHHQQPDDQKTLHTLEACADYRELKTFVAEAAHKTRGHDSAIETMLIDKIADLKTKVLQLTEKNHKLRSDIVSERLGQMGDAMVRNRSKNGGLDASEDQLEFQIAFQSQKEANRKLLQEVNDLRIAESNNNKEIRLLRKDRGKLQQQIVKQKWLIYRGVRYLIKLQNGALSGPERLQQLVSQEVSAVLMENIRLQQDHDDVVSEAVELRRGLRYFALRLQRHEGALIPDPERGDELLRFVNELLTTARLNASANGNAISSLGMIDLNMKEVQTFLNVYIRGLTKDVCSECRPFHLPMFVSLMVARKFDYFHQKDHFGHFLRLLVGKIKSIIKKKNDLEVTILWLSQVFCALNLFRQYSGLAVYVEAATGPRIDIGSDDQDELLIDTSKLQFVSYDISQFIEEFQVFCRDVFENVMDQIRENLLTQSLCISAFLEHEALDMSPQQQFEAPSAPRRPSKGHSQGQPKNTSHNVLLKHMQLIHDLLRSHNVDQVLINQIFWRIASYINSCCLNKLFLHAKLCTFHKGIQISYNISSFETWLRCQKLKDSNALDCLLPLKEAIQLLQVLMSDKSSLEIDDVMCQTLSVNQIVKIMHNFNSYDSCGGIKLSANKVDSAEQFLLSRPDRSTCPELLYPETPGGKFQLHLPFIASRQPLDKIVIPKRFFLPCLTPLNSLDIITAK